MSIAMVTTTIRTPDLLRQFRAMRDDVLFVIVGDMKSPHAAIEKLCSELTRAIYLPPDAHEDFGLMASYIPDNCVQKRNIGLLEAIQQGAEVIVSWDDDNAPYDDRYFDDLEAAFTEPVPWIAGRDDSERWFNPGAHASQQYYYRGFPYALRDHQDYHGGYRPADGEMPRVGVVNGLVLGDPDCSATERLERKPCVSQHSKMMWDGMLVDPRTCWSVFNSQNTAFIRELAPLMLLMPHIGRLDDIWGSLIAQRVMQEMGYGVRYGRPFVVQERNPHDLTRDLEQEMIGIRYTERFADDLRAIPLSADLNAIGNLNRVVEAMESFDYLPHEAFEFAREWVAVVRGLM